MKSISGTILLLVLSSVVSQATAQQSNVGYYQKIADNSSFSTYELIWSGYVPGAENYQPKPGDFTIPSDGGGGGSCDPNINECPIINSMLNSFSGVTELPPVVVTTSRPEVENLWILAYLTVQGGGGGGGSELPARPQLTPINPQSDPCEASTFSNLPSELSDLGQALIQFFNSSEARELWLDSRPSADLPHGRREQGGFLVPDENGSYNGYRFHASSGGSSTQCSVNLNYPGVPPAGTIPIHTHPFNPGDQPECPGYAPGTIYPGGPSDGDRNFLALPQFSHGVVMDGEQIYIFARHESDDPADPKVRCGY